MRSLAKSYLPRLVVDFIDGGVDGEECLDQNLAAFRRYRLLPRYLTGADAINQSTILFGREYSSTFGIAPMGLLGMFRPAADLMRSDEQTSELQSLMINLFAALCLQKKTITDTDQKTLH